MEALQAMGYLVLGLDGEAEQTIEQALEGQARPARGAGAGGRGAGIARKDPRNLRSRWSKSRLRADFGSLNVSNAAAVALYAVHGALNGQDGHDLRDEDRHLLLLRHPRGAGAAWQGAARAVLFVLRGAAAQHEIAARSRRCAIIRVVTPQPERGGPRNRPVTPQIDWSRAAQGKSKIKARPKKRKSTGALAGGRDLGSGRGCLRLMPV